MSSVNIGFIKSVLREENVSYFTTLTNGVYVETSNNSFMGIVDCGDKLEIINGYTYSSIFAECLSREIVDDYRKGKECDNSIQLLQAIASELAKK